MKRAVVVGFDHDVRAFCQRMNRYAAGWRFAPYPSSRFGLVRALAGMARADILIRLGGPLPHSSLMALARLRGIPVVIIWAGSDVLTVLRNPSLLNEAQKSEVVHLAVAPWLIDELRAAGIRARYMPIMGVEATAAVPRGLRQPCVLTDLSEPRREFYGRDFVYEVARGLPDMRFLALGAGKQDAAAPPNVRYLGWRPCLDELYDRSFAVLHVPEHDGMSLVVLEALARGRFVVWRYPLPGVDTVSTPEEACSRLRALWEEHKRNPERYNDAGVSFVRQQYEAGHVARGLTEFLEATLHEYASRRQRRRLAIVGYDLFCARVARFTNDLPTAWQAQVLHFETKIEHLASLLQLARADVVYSIGQPGLGRTVRAVTRALQKPRVVHWAGSDVQLLESRPQLRRDLDGPRTVHLAEIEWKVEELRPLGIEAAIAPLPPHLPASDPLVPALPETFTILAYLPRGRTAFYGGCEVERLIRDLSDKPVRFIIVGGGEVPSPPGAQVEHVGWTHALDDIYARSTVLVRFTRNDGQAHMVLEALAMGRHVLWTKSFPFVQTVATYEELRRSLTGLFDRHGAGRLVPQWEASHYVRTAYDPARCVQGLVAQWEKVTSYRRSRL